MRNNLWKHIKSERLVHLNPTPKHPLAMVTIKQEAVYCCHFHLMPVTGMYISIDVLSVMHQYEITTALRRLDSLITKFESRLHFRHGHLPHRWQRSCETNGEFVSEDA